MAFVGKMAFVFCCLLLVTEFLPAQQKMTDYNKQWKIVDSLIGKRGLTQSALEAVNKIYVSAKKEKQDAQLIKALIYQVSLQETTDETGSNTFRLLQTEIDNSSQPAKSILESILAEKYLFYFQQHRYQLYDRSRTVNFKKDDVASWGVDDFHEKIGRLYLSSISNEKLLEQTKLDAFDPVIIKGNVRNLRPTLFDLLAHRALSYFQNDEKNVTKAAYAFELDDEKLFSPAAGFSALTIKTRDSASLYHRALLIYQQLLSFHAGDRVPDALIDADIQRL